MNIKKDSSQVNQRKHHLLTKNKIQGQEHMILIFKMNWKF